MRTRIFAAIVMAFGLAFTALPASAGFIVGEIIMSGDVLPTGGTGLGDAISIAFPGNDFDVDGTTGDFAAAGIAQGNFGTINDFQFDPLTPAPHELWTIDGFTFHLQSVSIAVHNDSFLVLEGIGEVTGNGFDPTYGAWILTANGFTIFNFSSGTLVPEPTSLLLVGLGLFGLVAARRRRR